MYLTTTPVSDCPCCGAIGAVVIDNGRDYVTGLPGTWKFRECSHCRSLWQDPCPGREEIPALYPANYHFTRTEISVLPSAGMDWRGRIKLCALAEQYGYESLSSQSGFSAIERIASHLPGVKQRAGRTVRFIPSRSGGRLLDVGCGNGSFLRLMSDLGWECEGIEPDPKAAAVAQTAGLKVRAGNLEEIDLPANHYDAVSLSHVMEHFSQPSLAMQNMVRTLKPGGIFVSISPNPTGIIRRLFKDKWYELDAPRHLVLPSLRGYEALCKPVGLRTCCWTTMHIAFWILRESLSIRGTGAPGNCHATAGPRLFSALGAVLLSLMPSLGEEVVCFAKKETREAAT